MSNMPSGQYTTKIFESINIINTKCRSLDCQQSASSAILSINYMLILCFLMLSRLFIIIYVDYKLNLFNNCTWNHLVEFISKIISNRQLLCYPTIMGIPP